jgi:hypothetical protein
MPRKSQTDKVLDWLLKHGNIDESVAKKLKVKRLSGHIYRLKERGHTIWAYRDGYKYRYALMRK